MKLQLERPGDLNAITGYGVGFVMVNQTRHEANLVVTGGQLLTAWAPRGFDGLSEPDIAAVCALAPEVVIIGTGARQRFPAVELLRPLIEARIGFEVMDMAAACRTYNILVAEGRRVAAALLLA